MARRKKNRLLQHAEYALYRLIVAAVRQASDDTVLRWGSRFGTLAGKILRGRDRLAMRNLRDTFPEKSEGERREILDKCWRHFGREMLGYVRLQAIPPSEVLERCPLVNSHLLEEGLEAGHGVMLISAHFGGWEVGGLAVMALSHNVVTVARPLDNEFLERDLQQIRARTGAKVIDRKAAARPLMKALADNAIVVLLPDQAVLPREGVLVPFLGRAAWTTPAPARMAVRQDSRIVFAFCIPDGTRHRLEFDEPIRVDQLTEGERDPVALTKRINDVISARIAARPELWLWMHDRWKGTGESGAPDA